MLGDRRWSVANMDRPLTPRSGRRLGRRVAVVLIGLATSAAMGIAVAAGVGADPRAGLCNRTDAGAASVAFDLPRGADVRARIPRFGLAPELDAMGGPVTVVVFEGRHNAVPIFGGIHARASDTGYDNVVCVVSPSGEELYYSDVDRAGMNIADLAVDRVAP